MFEEKTNERITPDRITANNPNERKMPDGKKWGIIVIAALVLIALIAGIGIYNSPANRLSRHLDLGNRYLEEQNFEQAIVEFDKAIAIDPMCVDAYLGKAQAYEGMGDIDMAVQTLEEGYRLTNDERFLGAGESYIPGDGVHTSAEAYDDMEMESPDIPDGNIGNVLLSAEAPHNYTAYFESSFSDNGDYYEVTGKIVDRIMIPADIVESMSTGDGYDYNGITFIYEQKGIFEYGDYAYYTFTDSSGNQYVVDTHSSMTADGVTYYYIQDIRDYDAEGVPYSAGGGLYMLIDDNYIFHISKKQYVGMCTDVVESNGGSQKNYESFTIEEITENDIRDFYGNLFTQVTGLPVGISVDAEGKIGSFSLEQELPGNYLDATGAIKELSEINQ